MFAWCVCFVVLNLGFITAQVIIIPPVNTAAEFGSSARLNCTADLAIPGGGQDVLEWSHFVTDTTGTRIVISSAPDDILEEGFSLDYDAAEGRYDLIIDMSKDLGGNYMCHLYNANKKGEAQVVALANFGCSRRNGGQDVVEGQAVALDCEVHYRGYKQPSLEWASDDSGILQGNYVEDEANPEKIFYVSNLTAHAQHDRMEFSCNIAFAREDGEEEEPPHYKSTCTTSFEVKHGATNIVIYPNPDDFPDGVIEISVGSEMNCSAGGNPDPYIYWQSWQAGEGGDITEGPSLEIEEWMTEIEEETLEYKCVAQNTINMVDFKVEKLVKFHAIAEDIEPPPVTEGGLGQSLTIAPRNTAAQIGTSARFNCTADLQGDTLEWRHYFSSPSQGTRIVASNDPDDISDNRFGLNYDVDSGRYDLIMNSVTDDLAGKYVCQLISNDAEKKEVELVSLSGLTCSVLGNTTDVIVGTQLSLTCGVTYNGYKNPNLKWYHGSELPGEDTSQPPATPQSLLYVANITMESEHFGNPFRCELDFVAEGGAGQPPAYTDYCTSDTYTLTTTNSPSTTDPTDAGTRTSATQCNLFLVGFLLYLSR